MRNIGVYIGNCSSNGIYHYEIKEFKLINEYCTNDFARCTYLTQTNRNLYSTIEISDKKNQGNGYIVSYKKDINKLHFINKRISYGKGPCHIEINEKKNMLLVSNYIDGGFTVFNINEDGSIGEKIYNEINEEDKSHLHCAKFSLNNDFIFTVDLGADKLIAYELKDDKIQKVDELKFKQNTQPRHIVLSKEKIYVVTERSCEIYTIQFRNKRFKIENIIPIIAEKDRKIDDTGCAIKISRNFKYIYISVRGINTIKVFKINKNSIKMIQTVSCGGNTPRDLEMDKKERYVFVANQDSNEIAIFQRNKINGKIVLKSKQCANSPTCIIVE